MAKDKKVIAKKAWGINWGKIDGGAYCAGNIESVYADTRGKAKSLLLPDISDYKLFKTGEYVTYTTIPIVIIYEDDKYNFDGEILSEWEYEKKQAELKRLSDLQLILDDNGITHCYIRKGSYYRPNSCGYTDRIDRAGVYTKEYAVSHAKSCDELSIIPINKKEHNAMITNEIKELRMRLIS